MAHTDLLSLDGVLIESDWNLKESGSTTCSFAAGVLIESDWNLKYTNFEEKVVIFAY